MKKIIIVGAGLTGVTYALLLKQQGYEVDIYEKRAYDEIKNLDSIIFLKGDTLKILNQFIKEDIFSLENSKAYKEGPRKGLHNRFDIKEEHACVNLDDLLISLLKAAARLGIPVHRKLELQSFFRNENDTKTVATFKCGDNIEIKACDQLLLACGSRAIKSVLGNKYTQPVELHYVNVLGIRKPIDHSKNFNHDNAYAIAVYPEFNMASMVVAQIAAYYLNYCPTSIGNFSLYLATLNKFIMVSTYPPEQHDALMTNAELRVNFVRERLHNMRAGLSPLHKDFEWLKEIEETVADDCIVPITACSAVLLPDKALFKQGVIPIGDAFVTTPFIYGSEYNEHVQHAFPIISEYLFSLTNSNDSSNNDKLGNFIESLCQFILSNKRAGQYLRASDFMGNTMMREGSQEKRVNISPFIGYKLDREMLQALSEKESSWIIQSPYQDGGRLMKKEKPVELSNPPTRNYPIKFFDNRSQFLNCVIGAIGEPEMVIKKSKM